ncbi:MAG: glycosyltransferase family 4 protein [Alphaproteobacteria bacterium]|nr:glycosyltransferase family 4 protein [Alphaproteobacteria bacterium]
MTLAPEAASAASVPDAERVPAIRYAPRGRGGDDRLIVGLTVAAMSFFEAYMRATAPAAVVAYVRDAASLAAMREHAAAIGCDPERLVGVLPPDRGALAGSGAVLMQDPALAAEAALRPDPRAYSLIGVTHSLSSRESWREILNYPRAPLQPWDAIVCTTRAARAVVDGLLDAADETARGAGLRTPLPRPARPIVPLGVDAGAFAADPARRVAWRARHAVADDEVAVLFLGRLSLHAKAHPYALVAACAEAAGDVAAPLRLVFAGQFAKPPIRIAFQGLADAFAGRVRVSFIESPSDEERRDALSGADIFASFADSIQETFGLAPVEAMASGLPVVITDWDGYRDTARHGIEGFRVPTLMAPPPAADGALRSYVEGGINYDRFCAVLGQLVAVDIRAAASAIRVLANEPERRRAMGAAGVARVRATYDWPVVMGMWRQLWKAMEERRRTRPAAAAVNLPPVPRPDPLTLFRTFPTRRLGPSDRLTLGPEATAATIHALYEMPAFRYAFAHLPAPARIVEIAEMLAAVPGVDTRSFLAGLPEDRRAEALRVVLFLAKRDLLAVAAGR